MPQFPPLPRLLAAALVLAGAVVGVGCVEGQTPGDDLIGAWRQVDVQTGPGLEWVFHDDLTFDRTGEITDRGLFHVEDRRIFLEPAPGTTPTPSVAFDYVSTRDHWLAGAQYAVGDVQGRIGTWRGSFIDVTAGLTAETTTAVHADGTVHLARHLTGAARDELWEGDGTWAPTASGVGFTITVMLVGPAGATRTETTALWHLGDAIGGPLFERVSF